MQVREIFHSIQGESTYAGRPCACVRLTGCPLRCRWCDSEVAFYGGERMSVDEVIDQVTSVGTNLAEITGGEPLAQREGYPLTERLLDSGLDARLPVQLHKYIWGPEVERV